MSSKFLGDYNLNNQVNHTCNCDLCSALLQPSPFCFLCFWRSIGHGGWYADQYHPHGHAHRNSTNGRNCIICANEYGPQPRPILRKQILSPKAHLPHALLQKMQKQANSFVPPVCFRRLCRRFCTMVAGNLRSRKSEKKQLCV